MSKLYLWRDPGEEIGLGCIVIFVIFAMLTGAFWLGKTIGCPQ